MHRNVIFIFGFIVYFMVGTYAASSLELGLLTSTIAVLGVPILLLARFSAAPKLMLLTIGCFGVGVALMLEALGYLYGLWMYAGPQGVQALSGPSIAVLIFVTLKMVFLVLFYELLFDDGEYSLAKARSRFLEFGFFAIGTAVLVVAFYLFMDRLSNPNAYYWITIFLLLASVGMLLLRQAFSLRLFDKISRFVAVAVIPMLSLELLLQISGQKTFTAVTHSLTLPFLSESLPLGELLLALSVPTFVATVYELYLDDRV